MSLAFADWITFMIPSLYSPVPSWGHRVWRIALQFSPTLTSYKFCSFFSLLEAVDSKKLRPSKKQSPDLIQSHFKTVEFWPLVSTLQWLFSECQQAFKQRGNLSSSLSARCAGMARADGERNSSGALACFMEMKKHQQICKSWLRPFSKKHNSCRADFEAVILCCVVHFDHTLTNTIFQLQAGSVTLLEKMWGEMIHQHCKTHSSEQQADPQ